ncbi:F0F1 ATP synthase subunit delta [Mumia zhuanghuii]|uniref:ATP synthase subunit delta n=1 Tax=Mumia zhuanghuii TaxID=2585211 RepID=A0A5C4MHE1_9ACTN|nr:F0F1 ATP synthase subunit delta [Mumia zhuanghuii]TNC42872.1 F0F1 ATP synthase subunit delta [Mumia zhuanghuii]TNC43044.1 F0F1 ATP synthase subunit delta [Mumia zhuanghuii]
MRGVSAASLAQVLDVVDGAAAGGAEGVAVAEDVFAVVGALDTNPVLRRVLSDPASEGEAKAGLVRSLFGDKIGSGAVEIVSTAAQGRWGASRDVADALEQAGVQAVLSRAAHEGRLDQVADTLLEFARVVVNDPDLRQAVNDKSASVEGRQVLVARLLDGKTDDVTLALVRQAVAGRNHGFEQTLAGFAQDAIVREGRLQALVTAAYELSPDEKQRLAGALARKYGREVYVDVTVDPAVIGGLSVEIAGERIDSTVSTKLADARRGLVG